MEIDQRFEVIEAENDRLRDRVEQLERALFGGEIPLPLEWRLSGTEARVFGTLISRELVTKDVLMTALYSLRPDTDEPEMKICDVFICKLRKKLKPFGITIHTSWGRGWTLDPRDRERFKSNEKIEGTQ